MTKTEKIFDRITDIAAPWITETSQPSSEWELPTVIVDGKPARIWAPLGAAVQIEEAGIEIRLTGQLH